MLRVRDVMPSSDLPAIVEIDDYVPIIFKTWTQVSPGLQYIEISSCKRQLLELKLSGALVLRGFAWVIGDQTDTRGFAGGGPITEGLPVLEVPGADWSEGVVRYLDLALSVSLCCLETHIDIRIGSTLTFDRALSHGRVRFLMQGDELVGLRIVDLSDAERTTIAGHVQAGDAP